MAAVFPLQVYAKAALADERLQAALARATTQLGSRRQQALSTLQDPDAVRDRARAARMYAIANLAQLLERF